MFDQYFEKFDLAPEVTAALKKCKCIAYAETKAELEEMAYGPTHTSRYDVVYPIEGNGTVKEAEVVRCKNGCVVNFMEDYMRRRDPNSMAIGDDLPSDKPRFKDRFGYEFSSLRQETLDWLSTQQVIMLPFSAGPRGHGYPSLMICPLNAAFFALSLANMQGFTSIVDVPEHYKPRAIIFVAPPFRHTHFDGKQVVVHNRSKEMHEVWAYNLYPGPSAKKGVFSLLLDIGEQEGWVCCHTSAAMVETPYECGMEVVRQLQSELALMTEASEADAERGQEPLKLDKQDLTRILEQKCGMEQHQSELFATAFDEAFGKDAEMEPKNMMELVKYKVSTPNVSISLKREAAHDVQMRTIDGIPYILVRADDGVELNGIPLDRVPGGTELQ